MTSDVDIQSLLYFLLFAKCCNVILVMIHNLYKSLGFVNIILWKEPSGYSMYLLGIDDNCML